MRKDKFDINSILKIRVRRNTTTNAGTNAGTNARRNTRRNTRPSLERNIKVISKTILGGSVLTALLITGCAGENAQAKDSIGGLQEADKLVSEDNGEVKNVQGDKDLEEEPIDKPYEINVNEMFSAQDKEIGYDKASAANVSLGNQDVVINKAGTYVISGSLEGGQIIVEVSKDEEVRLVLENAKITSDNSAAIYVKEAKNVFVTLAEGTNNVLETTGQYNADTEDDVDGVVFSKADIIFNGRGSVEIKTQNGHGIVAKDDLVFTGGKYNINASSHGVRANDSIRILDGEFNISSVKDGFKSDNEEYDKGYIYIANGVMNIDVGGDSISASGTLQIDGGEFSLKSGNGFVEVLNTITMGEGKGNTVHPTETLEYSMKALKSNEMLINGGEFIISAYEDALHANLGLTINGGEFDINTGDDALHSDALLVINEIDLDVKEGYEGIEGESITINGGNIRLNVLDDAINVANNEGLLTISGGEIYLASKGDGIDSNGAFTMTGGNIVLNNTPIHAGGDGNVDVDGEVIYTGGTIKDMNGNDIDPTVKMQGGRKPGGMKPDGLRLEGTLPEGMKPNGLRPEGTLPEGMKPNGVRQEGALPEGMKINKRQ